MSGGGSRDRRDRDRRPSDRDRADRDRADRRDSQPDDEQQRRPGDIDLQESDSLTALKAVLGKVAALLTSLQLNQEESISLVEQLYGSVLAMDLKFAGETDDKRKTMILAHIQNTTITRNGDTLAVEYPKAEAPRPRRPRLRRPSRCPQQNRPPPNRRPRRPSCRQPRPSLPPRPRPLSPSSWPWSTPPTSRSPPNRPLSKLPLQSPQGRRAAPGRASHAPGVAWGPALLQLVEVRQALEVSEALL